MRKSKDFIIGVCLLFGIFFLTIGYALYEQLLSLNGDLSLKKPGIIQVTDISVYDKGNLPTGAGMLVLNNGKIELHYSFTISREEADYNATYLITIENNSPYDYNFSGFNIEPNIIVNGATAEEAGAIVTYEYVNLNLPNQVNVGGTIPSKETKVVAITIHFHVVSEKNDTTIDVNGGANVNTSTDKSGSFYGGIENSPVTLDLTGDNINDCFNVDVINTYKNQLMYTFTLTNNNFILVDKSGNTLNSFTIDAPSEVGDSNTKRIQLCMKIKEGSQFAAETEKTQVVINPNGLSSFSVGTLTINVDKDEEITYEGRPEVENVSFDAVRYDQDSSSLITRASWSRKDVDGLSIDKWYINLYSDSSSGLIKSFEIDGSENNSNYELVIPNNVLTSTSFVNALNNNSNFYIKVYGVDTNGNSGEDYCGVTTDYCVASSSVSLKYRFTLTYSGNVTMTNTTNNTATIYLNNSFTSVITANTNYTLSGVTITKGSSGTSTRLTNGTHYNYSLKTNSSTTADLTILENIIDDNITITATTYNSNWQCLVKGTQIKVYDGYKNIEDIKYDDLLVVYSYELGREVYEYPIKIEEEGMAEFYQQTTFSDGSILKTFGAHGIFSRDANKFVSVLDRANFNIGTTIFKVNNGKLEEVKVVKIEDIYEDTTYYNISSTRYLNVIANDFITTDPILPISNIFSFNDDLTWGADRDIYLATNDFIPYELLKNYFPRYLYDGIRMGEAKHLLNQGIISIEDYVSRFSKMKFEPIPVDDNGNNKWMVTTSIDLENSVKGSYYTEGDFYRLPYIKREDNKKFLGWYNTSDNKYYQEGDFVRVNHGMYFEAVWE